MNRPLLTLSLISLLIASCASTTQSRIENNPEKYSSLSPGQQALVEEGRIEQGMPKDGVYLALGKPENVSYGAGKGGDYEVWNYYSLAPVVSHRLSGYWGYGTGGYRCGRYSGWGFGPTISYVPKKAASVKFSGDLVDEFQTKGSSLY